MRILIFFIISVIFISGCMHDSIESKVVGNGITVERIFEYDGCIGYRFDDGRYRYFVKCGCMVTTETSYSCGKNCESTEEINTVISK